MFEMKTKFLIVVSKRKCPYTGGVSSINVTAFVKREAAVNDQSLKLRRMNLIL